MHECPKCGDELRCLSGESAHPDNWYCKDEDGCGWQAWDRSIASSDMEQDHLDITFEELLDIACRMSQDIQDYVDEGEKAGSAMTGSKELLEEFNVIYRRTNQHWMNQNSDGESVEINI